VKSLALAALLVLLAAAAAAEASTPTSYRVRVNWICRSYTPTGRQLDAELENAQAAGDYRAWNVALHRALRLDLEEHRRIEAIPVPTALEATMEPILERIRAIDSHLDVAERRPSELLVIDRLGRPLNAELAAAGLWDCG
jgi:hypothetical protein